MTATLAIVATSSRAAFSWTTSDGSQSITAGTVAIGDDAAGTLLSDIQGMRPGATYTKCINVAYTGTLSSDVKLFGSVGGTGLAAYVDTLIDIGAGAAAGPGLDCTGYVQGANLHNDTLADFGANHANFGNGLGGFAGAANPTTRSYRISQTLRSDNNAQGLSTTVTLTWEAQNT